MTENIKRGKFITFEGPDYCGKSTQITRAEVYLRSRGVSVELGREPGGTSLGGVLRRVLKFPYETYSMFNSALTAEADFQPLDRSQPRTPEAELMLFMAARAEFVRHVAAPTLESGKWLIADRFMDSTTAYQGGGRWKRDPAKIEMITALNNQVVGNYRPDLTILLDITAEEATRRARKSGRQDYMDRMNMDNFENIRAEYKAIAGREPERVAEIDGSMTVEAVADTVKYFINKLFG